MPLISVLRHPCISLDIKYDLEEYTERMFSCGDILSPMYGHKILSLDNSLRTLHYRSILTTRAAWTQSNTGKQHLDTLLHQLPPLPRFDIPSYHFHIAVATLQSHHRKLSQPQTKNPLAFINFPPSSTPVTTQMSPSPLGIATLI